MKSMTRAVATATRAVTGATRRARPGRGLTIVGWHRVDGRESDGLSTGVDDFCRHLDVLDEWGADVLPLDEAVDRLREGTLPPRAVVLTFDDGYASVIETAWPQLRERGMPATLFVVTDSLDRELSFAWDGHESGHQRLRLATADELVAAAAEGLDLGSHTVSHAWLPRLQGVELDHELVESRAAMERLLGREVTSIAYPTGGWRPITRDRAAAAGYRIGLTVDRGLNTARANPLSLRRTFAPHDPLDFRLVLDGAYTFLRPLDTLRNRRGPDW